MMEILVYLYKTTKDTLTNTGAEDIICQGQGKNSKGWRDSILTKGVIEKIKGL